MTPAPHQRTAKKVLLPLLAVALVANLAGVALPTYFRSARAARIDCFCRELRGAVAAFEMYAKDHERYPEETGAGVLPLGMEDYLHIKSWREPNTLGGLWDWDFEQGYATAALCVELPADPEPLEMLAIDRRIDNGVLSTGAFVQRSARRYAFIIAK